MTHPPVHWSEGMFLRPHHFQAADRSLAQQLGRQSALDVSHPWGLHRLALDLDALAASRLVVRELVARFRDGTVVHLPDDAALPELDLKPLFLGRTTLNVFVALPREARAGRHRVHAQPTDDENTGTNPQPVSYRAPAVRFLLGDEDQAGYEVLPLARLEKSERAEATPKLALGEIPPLLRCDAWPGLQLDILQQLYFRLNKKIEVLAAQVTSRGISFDSHSPGDTRRMYQLSQLNEAFAVLGHVAFVPGVPPWEAFRELCRVVGQLAIFGREARPPELPRYDHDDLGPRFWRLKLAIDALLNDVEDPAYDEAPFVGSGLRMQVTLKPEWMESGWQMFLGVRSNVTGDECVRMLTRPERLGMKIGSWDRADQIYTKGQEGLRFTAAAKPPRDLPSAPNLTYFEISRESATNEWAHVQKARTLAIRMQERDVVGTIEGKQELTIRTAGQAATFSFTLYLVPTVR